jgi:DNA mismatch endonuclease (patch repair protein)
MTPTTLSRSEIMSRIRSCNTQPELILKKLLPNYKYQSTNFGSPDFINRNKKIVIFVDGCFWHQCPIHSKKPKNNKEYWNPKLLRNKLRDKEVTIAYKNSGWKVLRIWEHELKKSPMNALKRLKNL